MTEESTALRVLSAGPGTTLQDGGRHGYLRYGITAAGPMDRLAHATANLSLGCPAQATAIEVSLGGIALTAEGAALTVAVAGGAFAVSLDGQELGPDVALTLEPGAVLGIRAGAGGSWCYLAVAGDLDVAPVLGSTATHIRSGMGGLEGRGLRAGDRIRVLARHLPLAPSRIDAPWLERAPDTIRVLPGPQADAFDPDQIDAFLAADWTISNRSDRMASYLDGPRLRHAAGHDIVSDGIVMGAIQVPGDGRPVVLMADRQPTGGYPKIATVIGPDLGRFAQGRPGTRLRFRAVTREEAVAARRDEAACLRGRPSLEPLVRTRFTSEFLLGLNLVDGICGPDDGL
ncbi:biotin-dependent carboxyltransferase family protein [Methylobacterium sp. J-068]|uniref:5-oxoprolinase subunit C family protein n=1 Tax=Methylobacterium sp. J-068 TaxID=2836649 RepID=UPI001FBA506D|nr:biotin-dependent carboxyltransferase family protein [Methylobacterium sp. J-068]MCJ2034013.1 biotin-dependent carboxyltransferase family protein [Methylobacterium sp. J-068]